MLTLNLKSIFTARGIDNAFTFLMKNGFPRGAATKLLNNEKPYIRFDQIEKLCEILVCEPNDLFIFQANKNQLLAENHPLNKLKPIDNISEIKQTWANRPYKEIVELIKGNTAQ